MKLKCVKQQVDNNNVGNVWMKLNGLITYSVFKEVEKNVERPDLYARLVLTQSQTYDTIIFD
jgi:hypothetical protein